MNGNRQRQRRLGARALALLGSVLVLVLFGGVGGASAHAALTGTDPRDGSVLVRVAPAGGSIRSQPFGRASEKEPSLTNLVFLEPVASVVFGSLLSGFSTTFPWVF